MFAQSTFDDYLRWTMWMKNEQRKHALNDEWNEEKLNTTKILYTVNTSFKIITKSEPLGIIDINNQ